MASGYNIEMINTPLLANVIFFSSVFQLPLGAMDVIYTHTVSDRTDGSFISYLAHSHDGLSFSTLSGGASIFSNTTIFRSHAGALYHYIRMQITATSVTSGAHNRVVLSYDMRYRK